MARHRESSPGQPHPWFGVRAAISRLPDGTVTIRDGLVFYHLAAPGRFLEARFDSLPFALQSRPDPQDAGLLGEWRQQQAVARRLYVEACAALGEPPTAPPWVITDLDAVEEKGA